MDSQQWDGGSEHMLGQAILNQDKGISDPLLMVAMEMVFPEPRRGLGRLCRLS